MQPRLALHIASQLLWWGFTPCLTENIPHNMGYNVQTSRN